MFRVKGYRVEGEGLKVYRSACAHVREGEGEG